MAWIIVIEWLSRVVLLGLIGLSVWSISIIVDRRRFFKSLELTNDFEKLKSLILRNQTSDLSEIVKSSLSPHAVALNQGMAFKNSSAFEQAMSSSVIEARKLWEKGLPVLGTLGSTSPFVGLFGTILGIIVAFGALSTGQSDSLKVMFLLAEALILTAVGLAVAIPAVVANNYFNRKIIELTREIEALKDLALAQLLEKKN